MSEVKKTVNEDGVVIDDNGFPAYGTPGYIFTLAWHDEAKRDYLVVVDCKKESEVMAARAKGTTIYELIDMYGGIDEVTAAFAGKESDAVYADVSDAPEFADNSAYDKVIQDLAKLVAEQQAKQATETTKENEGQANQEEDNK